MRRNLPVSARIANIIPISILKRYEVDWLLQQIKSAIMAASGELRDRLCCSKLSHTMYHSIVDHAVCLPALDHVSTYFESLTTAPQVGTITISLGQRCHFSQKYHTYLQSEIGVPTCDGLHVHTCI